MNFFVLRNILEKFDVENQARFC